MPALCMQLLALADSQHFEKCCLITQNTCSLVLMYVMGVNSQVFFDELAVSNDAFELSGF